MGFTFTSNRSGHNSEGFSQAAAAIIYYRRVDGIDRAAQSRADSAPAHTLNRYYVSLQREP